MWYFQDNHFQNTHAQSSVIGGTAHTDLRWVVFSEGAYRWRKRLYISQTVGKKAVPIAIILIIEAIVYGKHSKYFMKDIY